MNFTKKKVDQRKLKDLNENVNVRYVVDVVLYVNLQDKPLPLNDIESDVGDTSIIPMYLECIDEISSVRLILPSDIRSREGLRSVFASMREVYRRFDGEIPKLDPITDLNITEPEYLDLFHKYQDLHSQERDLSITKSPHFLEFKSKFDDKKHIKQAVALLNGQLKASKTMILQDD